MSKTQHKQTFDSNGQPRHPLGPDFKFWACKTLYISSIGQKQKAILQKTRLLDRVGTKSGKTHLLMYYHSCGPAIVTRLPLGQSTHDMSVLLCKADTLTTP